MQQADDIAEKPAEMTLADEVRAFLAEFELAKNQLDNGVYPGFAFRLLTCGVTPRASSVRACRDWMARVRADEPERMRVAAALIRADDGYVCMTPGDGIERAPAGVSDARIRRMIATGWLVPSGDAMFGTTSQTYKLSSLAE